MSEGCGHIGDMILLWSKLGTEEGIAVDIVNVQKDTIPLKRIYIYLTMTKILTVLKPNI